MREICKKELFLEPFLVLFLPSASEKTCTIYIIDCIICTTLPCKIIPTHYLVEVFKMALITGTICQILTLKMAMSSTVGKRIRVDREEMSSAGDQCTSLLRCILSGLSKLKLPPHFSLKPKIFLLITYCTQGNVIRK